jgi:hypothetical protein
LFICFTNRIYETVIAFSEKHFLNAVFSTLLYFPFWFPTMINMIKALQCATVTGLIMGFALVGKAQNLLPFFTPHLSAGIEKGTQELSAPFAGGLRAAQFAMADLDRDGKSDLVVFNSSFSQLKIRAFLNKGAAGNPKWVYAPRFAAAFPTDVTGYLKLVDYNCDGIPDLFHHGMVGVSVNTGYYDANNELKFTFYKDLYTPGQSSVYVGNLDEPAIADVDGDGDVDVVSYSIFGSFMYYYRNYRVERSLPCDSMQMEVESGCWARAGQGIHRKLVTGLYATCSTLPLWSGQTENPTDHRLEEAAKTTAHGYNSVCLLDMDGDGDMDVLNGNAVFSDLQYQQNGRFGSSRPMLDSIVAQDTLWQSGGKRVALPAYPTAYHLDIDGDGKKDIVVAPREESDVTRDQKQIWYYRNEGTAQVPDFRFQKDSLLSEDMMDGGSDSHPLYYDFNKDGKTDILVGSTFLNANGTRQNRLSYYQNRSTDTGTPKYRYITDNLANVNNLASLGCVPAVGDLDGDGKDDLLIGGVNGQFAFYRNMASTNAVQPVWSLNQAVFKNPNGTPIAVEANAAPFIWDINADGLPDIIAGSQAGRLTAFINTNITQGIPVFGVRKDSVGGPDVLVDANYSQNRYSTPYIGRIDSSQMVYLIMGSNSGTVKVWSGVGTGNLNATYTLESANFSNLKVPPRCAPAFGDGDGDGRPEMLLGSSWGGLFSYASYGTSGVGAEPLREVAPVIAFPNPAQAFFTVRRSNSSNALLQLTLRNIMGQTVAVEILRAGEAQTDISTAQLPAGIYLLSVQNGSVFSTLKITVLK